MKRPLKNRVRKKLLLLAEQWDRETSPPEGYPQLWTFNSGIQMVWPRLTKLLQWLCWLLVGHEPSKTEWGYGGGQYADRWCRWCNKMIRVQKESLYDEFGPTKISDMIGVIDNGRKEATNE